MSVLRAYPDVRQAKSQPYDGFDCEVTIPWTIECDKADENPLDIRDSGKLPRRFDPFANNIFLTCRKMTLTRETKNPKWWRADVYYSSQPLSQKEQEENDKPNPLDRESEIDWDATAYRSPLLVSLDGRVIASTAGELPDQPAEQTAYYWQATVTKNVAAPPLWLLQCAGRINSTAYSIDGVPVDAKHSRLIALKISRKKKENGYSYRQLTLGIEFREKREPRKLADGSYESASLIPDPFDLEIPDMGLMEIGDDGNLVRMEDSRGRPTPVPIPLDGGGHKLESPTFFNTTLLAFPYLKEFDFNQLPLT